MRAAWMLIATTATAMAMASVAIADPKIAANLEVPTVPYGLDNMPTMLATPWPMVVVSTKGIAVDGKALVAISEGNVPADEKEGGALGMEIPRLRKFTEAFIKASKTPITGITIAMDKSLPYRLLVEVIYSIKKAGVKNFAIVAHTTQLGVVPVTLPDRKTVGSGGGGDLEQQIKDVRDGKPARSPPADQPIKLVVSLARDKLVLWSISGLEGTLKTPKLTVVRGETTKLTAALAEIVKRRFAGKRSDTDRSITLMADGQVSMQDVLSVMVAIRTEAAGKDLFPDVLLSIGFD